MMGARTIACATCGEAFTVKTGHRSGRLPTFCPPCSKERRKESNRERQARWRKANPEKWKAVQDRANAKRLADPEHREWKRRNEIRRNYGIEPYEYDRMLAEHAGRCAICRQPPRGKANGGARDGHPASLHVDHCHDTDAVRGLLCSNCNTMIGLAGDDPVVLQAAIDYLSRGE